MQIPNIIITNNLNEARKKADSLRAKGDLVAVLSQDDEFNRKILETKKVDLLIINEDLPIKDYMKQRNSGLNEVLANLCIENKVKIGIDIEKIIKKSDKDKARSLARLMQNIMLCKKAGVELVFIGNNKDKKALQSLLLSLGASTKQALEAIR